MAMPTVSRMRSIAAVVVGYLLAVLSNSTWVIYSYANPGNVVPAPVDGTAAEVTPILVAMTVAMFVVSGIVSGFVLGKIAANSAPGAGLATAGLLAAVGVVNLLMGMSIEPTWHVLAAIFVQAPAVVAGSRLTISGSD